MSKFHHLKLWIAVAIHNFQWGGGELKLYLIYLFSALWVKEFLKKKIDACLDVMDPPRSNQPLLKEMSGV